MTLRSSTVRETPGSSAATAANPVMFRRIEVAFPVRDAKLRKRVVEEGLSAYLADTRDAWSLMPDGAWRKVASRRGKRMRSAQRELLAAMREPDDGD